jgi:predicted nucleic acid-binding protein
VSPDIPCALCRPFDDQSFIRIRLESEAVKLILQRTRDKRLRLLLSPVHYKEIGAFSDEIERTELLGIITHLGEPIKADPRVTRVRAEVLVRNGFGVADAAHVAYAETGGADFITCDDKLLKKCGKSGILSWSGDPLQFCSKENLK